MPIIVIAAFFLLLGLGMGYLIFAASRSPSPVVRHVNSGITSSDAESLHHTIDTLRKSEEHYRVLAESTIDAIILHENGIVIHANNAVKRVYGYEPSELLGQNSLELLAAPDSLEVVRDTIAAGFEGVYQATLRRKDGTTFNAEIHARNVIYQGRQMRVTSSYSISIRKKVEAELRELNTELEQRVEERTNELRKQQTSLNAILDSIGEGVFYTEGQQIRVANQALFRMTGYSADTLMGKRAAVLLDRNISPDTTLDFTKMIREKALNDPSRIWRGDTQFMRQDGTFFDAALTFTVLTSKENRITGAVVVVRDITDAKRLEMQKTTFVANASHELRTPLTNVKTRLYLLRKQPENFDQHLLVLERVADRMQNVVEELLDITRFERGVISLHHQDISFQELIEEVIRTQQPEAQKKDITLSSDLPLESVQLRADPDRLIQVIVNLTVNAINYTPPGGRVSIEMAIEDNNKAVVLRVRDTGLGIPEQYLTHIFEPFFRVNEGAVRGTGLGLSISKVIVELHGGSLNVESNPQVGSTFTVRLPISEMVHI